MIRKLVIIAMAVFTISFPLGSLHAETVWTPSVSVAAGYDDNINFERTEPEDDFIYGLEPRLRIESLQDLTTFRFDGRVIFRWYQENEDLNDQIYDLELNGDTQFTERSALSYGYLFRKDTTLDSELQEIGRIFEREDRVNHILSLAPSFSLNERMSIALAGRYRNVAYDSETLVDYSVVDLKVPIRWRLSTQVDYLVILPGWNYRTSEDINSSSPSLSIGWDHESTERLTLNFSLGVRHTTKETVATNETNDIWRWIGALGMNYRYPRGNFLIDFKHDLRNSPDGALINVSRFITSLRWNFTERFNIVLNGGYYYTYDDNEDRTNTEHLFNVGSDLFYNLTENYSCFLSYEYTLSYMDYLEDGQDADRNEILAGIKFAFPMK